MRLKFSAIVFLFFLLIMAGNGLAWAGSGPKLITVDEAKELFESNKALFVDARSASDFQKGHVKGALNLSVDDFDRDFTRLKPYLDPNRAIVTYCDGEYCFMGEELAEILEGNGYQNLMCISNGWTVWKEHGLPVARGKMVLPESAAN